VSADDPNRYPSSVRRNAITNYFENAERMKRKHDRIIQAADLHVGIIVGVVIKKELRGSEDTNKLPAVILSTRDDQGRTKYKLGSMHSIIEGWYDPSDLIVLNYSAYYKILDLYENPSDNIIFQKKWSKTRTGKKKKEIGVLKALKLYIDLQFHPTVNQSTNLIPNNHSDDDEVKAIDDNDAVVGGDFGVEIEAKKIKLSDSNVIPNFLLNATSCHICGDDFHLGSSKVQCQECNSIMHVPSECVLPLVHITNDDGSYCSRKCVNKTEIYETEIVDFKARRGYKVIYNTGTSHWISKKLVEKFIDYASVLRKYKLKCSADTTITTSHQIIDLTSNTTSTSTDSPIIAGAVANPDPDSSYCCVCDGQLSEDNWHKCAVCKKPMHGYIICIKRDLIVQDDDKLYCSKQCSMEA
jgi:hypothetical protein